MYAIAKNPKDFLFFCMYCTKHPYFMCFVCDITVTKDFLTIIYVFKLCQKRQKFIHIHFFSDFLYIYVFLRIFLYFYEHKYTAFPRGFGFSCRGDHWSPVVSSRYVIVFGRIISSPTVLRKYWTECLVARFSIFVCRGDPRIDRRFRCDFRLFFRTAEDVCPYILER